MLYIALILLILAMYDLVRAVPKTAHIFKIKKVLKRSTFYDMIIQLLGDSLLVIFIVGWFLKW